MNYNEVYEIAQIIYEAMTDDEVLTWPHVDTDQWISYRDTARNVIIQLDTLRENASKGK